MTDTIVPNDQFCKNVFLGLVGVCEKLMQNISLYPNPVKDLLHIENPDLEKLRIYVYNNSGKVISINSGSNKKYSVDLSDQPAGLYLIRIVTNDAEATKKIIKQ